MPKEYEACKRSEIESGKSEKQAQKICAVSYYKKHGKTPQQAHKEGKASPDLESEIQFSDDELALFDMIELVGGAFKKAFQD